MSHDDSERLPLLVYLFGAPASGKNYVGEQLRRHCGFEFHDADDWLPRDLLDSLQRGVTFTSAQRDRYYTLVCDRATALLDAARARRCGAVSSSSGGAAAPPQIRIAIAQATFKNRHRELVLSRHPAAHLCWVRASAASVNRRLVERSGGGGSGSGSAGAGASNAAGAGGDQSSGAAASLAAGSAAADAEWCQKFASGFEAPTHPHAVFENEDEDTGAGGAVGAQRKLRAFVASLTAPRFALATAAADPTGRSRSML